MIQQHLERVDFLLEGKEGLSLADFIAAPILALSLLSSLSLLLLVVVVVVLSLCLLWA